ncbi:MAG: ABC transporter permease [Archaeoglobaceae archaeon]
MVKYVNNRDILISLTKYEFKIRYRGTFLGLIWSFLAPLLLALVLYFVFRNLFGWVENFAAYVIVGVFVFRFFSVATSVGMGSLLSRQNLVTKTNVERKLIPLSTTLSYGLSSFIEILILIPILHALGVKFSIFILLLPIVHIVNVLFIFAINLFLSAMMVYFRDLNQIWDVVLNIIFFASPVVYPLAIIPEPYHDLYMLNPIACFIELYRSCLVYGSFSINQLIYVIFLTFILLTIGHIFFNTLQRRFGEVL